jgi:hypothetical protein
LGVVVVTAVVTVVVKVVAGRAEVVTAEETVEVKVVEACLQASPCPRRRAGRSRRRSW